MLVLIADCLTVVIGRSSSTWQRRMEENLDTDHSAFSHVPSYEVQITVVEVVLSEDMPR